MIPIWVGPGCYILTQSTLIAGVRCRRQLKGAPPSSVLGHYRSKHRQRFYQAPSKSFNFYLGFLAWDTTYGHGEALGIHKSSTTPVLHRDSSSTPRLLNIISLSYSI